MKEEIIETIIFHQDERQERKLNLMQQFHPCKPLTMSCPKYTMSSKLDVLIFRTWLKISVFALGILTIHYWLCKRGCCGAYPQIFNHLALFYICFIKLITCTNQSWKVVEKSFSLLLAKTHIVGLSLGAE